MIIKKIEVKGHGKQTASIGFSKGLNVIAGASDTGKSYITECFQFIFGAKEPPKNLDQAEGYTHLEVTFEDNDGSEFRLSRELKSNADVICTEKKDDEELTTVYKPTHKGSPNLSEFFLNKFSLNNMTLAKGLESMNHASLTLRVFEKILLADEERIISKNSPIGSGQNTEKTQELSFLKTVLTGIDDAEIKSVKKSKESKESIARKKNNLEDFLERFFPASDDQEHNLDSLDKFIERLEASHCKAESELNDLLGSNKKIMQEKEELNKRAGNLSQEASDDKALLIRFEMLESKYLSDRERLEANSEATNYIKKYQIYSCPLCDSEINQDSDEIDLAIIVSSNASEIRKIDNHLIDLRITQEGVRKILLSNDLELKSIIQTVEEKNNILSSSIGSKLSESRTILTELDRARIKFRKERDQEQKRKEIFEEIGRLQTDLDKIKDSYQIAEFSKELKSLVQEISKILVRWGFKGAGNLAFDMETRDIKIDGKPRSHFGKGYRAICFSSVLLGFMEYLYPKSRHPGFVILDSPLTTYKKRDEALESDNEEVFLANNLIYAFYRDLCDFYKDKQIIVLENQEPSEDLIPLMNYIHFSGNPNVGRYGFFPISVSN
ncbi:MAG: AAA family ATPase [Pseudomonas sp.]|nr:AAA family ATPase [Pseudomonas sp.]